MFVAVPRPRWRGNLAKKVKMTDKTPSGSQISTWIPDEFDYIPSAILIQLQSGENNTIINLAGKTLEIPCPIVNLLGNPKIGEEISLLRDRQGLRIASCRQRSTA
jgi:hypothetical protein